MNPFEGYIGQESLIRTLTYYLSLPTFPHVFFSAPKGSGKTELANRIANALNKKAFEFSCSRNLRIEDVIRTTFVKSRNKGAVLFLDEISLLPKSAQASLRTLAESGKFTDKNGRTFLFNRLTILAASSDIMSIDDDLLDRFDIMEFEELSIDDLVQIGQGFASKNNIHLSLTEFEKLALACKSSPRTLRQLISNVSSSIVSMGEKPSIDSILKIARIDDDGLTVKEQRLIVYIGDFMGEGVNPSISRLATALRASERMIIKLIETVEFQGFVSTGMGPNGRTLTPLGMEKYFDLKDKEENNLLSIEDR